MDQQQARGRESGPEAADRGQSTMQRSDQGSTADGARGGGGGDWHGYVVPYRYYGRGHAGVGYYAVYYQGDDADSGDGRAAGSQGGGSAQGTGTSSSSGFSGRGPKGYRRSDERIREEINDLLTEHDELDASEIEVTVKDGEATLNGTVDSRRSKRLAGDITEGCRGVRDVMNQIRIATGDEQTRGASSGSGSEGRSSRDTAESSGRDEGRSDREPAMSGAGRSSRAGGSSDDSGDSSDNGSRRRTGTQGSGNSGS